MMKLVLRALLLAFNARAAVAQEIPSGCCATAAMLRFACSQLVIERVDPLVSPGIVGSPHNHQIVGGNSFNATMEPVEYDPAKESSCTSCEFSEDFSNYWTANLYFRARNGTFKRVPQMANLGLRQNGGITVYYIPPYDGKSTVTAFKPGFRMLVGDPALRKGESQQRQLCHRCYTNVEQNPFGGAPCTGDDTASLPQRTCDGGIRTTITFPTCWDGKNLDSPDHKTHVAYPESGTFETTGSCPSSHPIRLPQLMYEIMWDTRRFNIEEEWPEDGSQPFFYSMGDGTGYGQHGDYLFGWKDDTLQRALDARCTGNRCAQLKTQSTDDTMACTKEQQAREDIEGWIPSLPGDMAITW